MFIKLNIPKKQRYLLNSQLLSGILKVVGERKGLTMKEEKPLNNKTKEARKQEKYRKKLKERFYSQTYPEFSSPVVYLRYKELKLATEY